MRVGNGKVPLTKTASPPTETCCAVAILLVLPPRLCDGCDGCAAPNTTCSAPFTAYPILLGVVHHRCATAVGASNGDAKKMIYTNEVVLRCYGMTKMKAFMVNVV